MSYIKGKFKNMIFESDSGYKVGIFRVLESDDEDISINKSITFTGYFSDINKDDKYILYGKYVFHNRYGYQYAVSSYEKVIPEGKDAIIDFLTSSFVKGCGEKLANNIYDVFKDESLEKIKENKDNLLLVNKMTEKKATSIYNSVIKYFDSDKEIIELKRLGFSVKETMNLINTYGKGILKLVNDDIYFLVGMIDFRKLDNIFLNSNDKEDPRRIKACIVECMKSLTFSSGDIYLTKEEIINSLKRDFNIDSKIEDYLLSLSRERKIIIMSDRYYLIDDYLDEMNIANSVCYLMNKKKDTIRAFKSLIKKIENELNITYNEEQLDAIKSALEENISIITGGPGTGKTTIINGIVKMYSLINNLSNQGLVLNIRLLAPTGRAAKRMSETTHLPAMTIHRFLKWDKETNTFGVNDFNKEKFNLYIIDEVSMIDNHLLSSLFKGINLNTKIVFVGDAYQLPSVGPGLVLSDMINANIKHIELKNIYRQSDNSFIPILAQYIKEGYFEEDYLTKRDDFNFIVSSSKQAKEYLTKVLLNVQKKKIDISKVQVLAPMYKGENGIDNLNILLQDIFNPEEPNKEDVKIGPVTYRVGDKILNLINDPDKNIYNGDIGFIEEVNIDSKADFLIINYEGNHISYMRDEIVNITHAYAMSIHKSQGSEFDHVILLVTPSFSRMLYNRLLYTAVSRAKKSLIIIGSINSFHESIMNNYSKLRKTTLLEKIENNLKNNG